MLRRVDIEDAPRAFPWMLGPAQSEPVVPAIAQMEQETTLLPRDHPRWVKDSLTISQRARDLIERIKPAIVHVLTFWDHRLRSLVIAGRRVNVDASGSYRAD